jgi:hypothetical protein
MPLDFLCEAEMAEKGLQVNSITESVYTWLRCCVLWCELLHITLNLFMRGYRIMVILQVLLC